MKTRTKRKKKKTQMSYEWMMRKKDEGSDRFLRVYIATEESKDR
jgi:hypothetical protein